jgi:trimeric autotransporter adhesin
MNRTSVFLTVCLFLISSMLPLMAQSNPGTGTVVPRLVNYSGKVIDAQGKPLPGLAGVTFAIYKDQEGGAPLWMETQNVQADARGNYSVQLGATSPEGLALDLFSSGDARWLGVRVNGADERPRALLLSVPYALKAADAETIGGLPASAFVRSDGSQAAGTNPTAAKTTSVVSKNQAPQANPDVTGKGVVNFIPMWDTTRDIIDSLIFQKSSSVGINTKTPAATLDVSGTGDVRDTLTLFPKGTDPTLAVNGTAFKVDSTGKVTFVSAQTFPGNGTVTSVALSAPTSDFTVTGSPIKKAGTLGLNWTVVPTSSDTANAIVKRDSNGSFSSGEIIVTSSDVGVSSTGSNNGIYGTTSNSAGNGVWGYNPNHTGVYGDGGVGVWGHSGSGYGVFGASFGTSAVSDGVHGETTSGGASGVAGVNSGAGGVGVYGTGDGYGVYGISGSGGGTGVGAVNTSTGDAVFADNQSGGFAGFFLGDVDVDGNLSKAGGSFKIDHPLDPANKYLYHSFVESPDMMNIYNGNVTTDSAGNAVVAMPDWFEALNQDFRYQLTVMGQFAQAIVAGKIANHSFAIQTDKPNVEVSWQVTGVRHDAWADAHRIPVEQLKADRDRGLYLHPELFGAAPDKSIAEARHPELKTIREKAQHSSPIN